MSISLYRHLLRAQRMCFRGDLRMINASRQETRNQFKEGKITFSEGMDILKIFQHNIAQATKNSNEPYYRMEIGKDLEINEFISNKDIKCC